MIELKRKKNFIPHAEIFFSRKLFSFATRKGPPQHHMPINLVPFYLTHPVNFRCGRKPDYPKKTLCSNMLFTLYIGTGFEAHLEDHSVPQAKIPLQPNTRQFHLALWIKYLFITVLLSTYHLFPAPLVEYAILKKLTTNLCQTAGKRLEWKLIPLNWVVSQTRTHGL